MCKVTTFQVGTILTCHTMDGQTHTIGKAIRPLFADPVTYGDEVKTLIEFHGDSKDMLSEPQIMIIFCTNLCRISVSDSYT